MSVSSNVRKRLTGDGPRPFLPLRIHVRQPPSPRTLFIQRSMITFVIATFMTSIYAYKAWYIAAACATAVTAYAIVDARLRYRGVLNIILPLGVYFGWLLTTSLWAEHPRDTIWYSTMGSIGIVVAALFYLLALNQPDRVGDVFLSFAWLAVPITILIYWRNPEASRSGGYAIAVLPFVPAFCWADIARRRRTLFAFVSLLITFALLIFARSRTPIAVAFATMALAVFVLSTHVLVLIRRTIVTLLVVALAYGALVWFAPTRRVALVTLTRFTNVDVRVGDTYVTAESGVDPVRVDLHRASSRYGREYFFFGMGYRNFPYFFARYWDPLGRQFTLHSMYETWLVEGGIVCVAIVVVIFIRQFVFLFRAMRRSTDAEVRRLARVASIATVGVFVFGAFHQTHDYPIMYALLGVGAAVPYAAPLRHRPLGAAREGRGSGGPSIS